MTTRTKKAIKTLVIGAVILAVGILIFTNTSSFLKILMVAAGVGALVDGIYTLAGVRIWRFTKTTKTLTTIKGFESVLLGLGAIAMGLFAASEAFTIMVYIFAISLVFSAVVSFQNSVVVSAFNIREMRGHFLAEALIQLLIAVILFMRPLDTLDVIVKIISIGSMVVGSICLVVGLLLIFVKSKKTVVVEEAEVISENN